MGLGGIGDGLVFGPRFCGSVGPAGGRRLLGMPPRLRNGMRNCGFSPGVEDNRRLFRSCSGADIVAPRRRLDRSEMPSLPDFGRSGGGSSLLGLGDLEADDLCDLRLGRLNDDLEPTMVCNVFGSS
jgi:hypothetical protein